MIYSEQTTSRYEAIEGRLDGRYLSSRITDKKIHRQICKEILESDICGSVRER